jgi:hypothetical protein
MRSCISLASICLWPCTVWGGRLCPWSSNTFARDIVHRWFLRACCSPWREADLLPGSREYFHPWTDPDLPVPSLAPAVRTHTVSPGTPESHKRSLAARSKRRVRLRPGSQGAFMRLSNLARIVPTWTGSPQARGHTLPYRPREVLRRPAKSQNTQSTARCSTRLQRALACPIPSQNRPL